MMSRAQGSRAQGSRVQGSRVRVSSSTRRVAVYSVTVVALTAALLVLAGTSPRDVGRPVADPSRVQLESRTFTCAGGIAGATVRSGSLRAGLAAERTIPEGRGRPATVVADRAAAPGAFAGQQALGAGGLAWGPCPEARARWWFVGAGALENTHNTVFTITNPRDGEASVDIGVLGPSGPVQAPAFQNIAVAPRTSLRIDLAKLAPAAGNLAVSIEATRGLVAVSAVDKFAPGSVGEFAREWLPPQALPATSITLAGLPMSRGPSALVVANPNDVDAIVKVEVIGQTGTFVPEALREFIVGPGAVLSVSTTAVVDGKPMALKVTSEQKITATVRSVIKGDTSFATGVRVIRGATAFAVPDGNARLLLSSVKAGTSVRVLAFGSGRQQLVDRTVMIGAQTTLPFALPPGTRYVRLVPATATLVAGFAVVGPQGVAAAGIPSAVPSTSLPKVRAGN